MATFDSKIKGSKARCKWGCKLGLGTLNNIHNNIKDNLSIKPINLSNHKTIIAKTESPASYNY